MCWKEGEAEGGKDTAPYAPYHAASASVDPQAELSVEAKKQDEDNIKLYPPKLSTGPTTQVS